MNTEQQKIYAELSKAATKLFDLILSPGCPDLGINVPAEFARAKHNAISKIGIDWAIDVIRRTYKTMEEVYFFHKDICRQYFSLQGHPYQTKFSHVIENGVKFYEIYYHGKLLGCITSHGEQAIDNMINDYIEKEKINNITGAKNDNSKL